MMHHMALAGSCSAHLHSTNETMVLQMVLLSTDEAQLSVVAVVVVFYALSLRHIKLSLYVSGS